MYFLVLKFINFSNIEIKEVVLSCPYFGYFIVFIYISKILSLKPSRQ